MADIKDWNQVRVKHSRLCLSCALGAPSPDTEIGGSLARGARAVYNWYFINCVFRAILSDEQGKVYFASI